jgi:hypothetical protein
MYRSIMVPLDGSRAAEHALPLAISIACRAGATLQLAHVHDVDRPMFMDPVLLFDDRHNAEHRQRERAYLDDLARHLTQRNKLTIMTILLDGAPAAGSALSPMSWCAGHPHRCCSYGPRTRRPTWPTNRCAAGCSSYSTVQHSLNSSSLLRSRSERS